MNVDPALPKNNTGSPPTPPHTLLGAPGTTFALQIRACDQCHNAYVETELTPVIALHGDIEHHCWPCIEHTREAQHA